MQNNTLELLTSRLQEVSKEALLKKQSEKIVLVTIAVAVKLNGSYKIPDTLMKAEIDDHLKEWSDGRYSFYSEMILHGVQDIVRSGIYSAHSCYADITWPGDDSKEIREACTASVPEYVRAILDLCTVSVCDDTLENREKITQVF